MNDFHVLNAKLSSYQYGVYYAEIALKPGMKDYLLATPFLLVDRGVFFFFFLF